MALTVPASGDLRAVLINNNASKTNNPSVDLILSAEDATEMMISNASDFAGAVWETFVTAKEWTLADEQVGAGAEDREEEHRKQRLDLRHGVTSNAIAPV